MRDVQLFAKAEGESTEWERSHVSVDQDIGGGRFVDSMYELEQGAGGKAVCAQFLQWNSARGHVARIVVEYTTGAAMAGPTGPVPAVPGENGSPAHVIDAATTTVGGDSVTPEVTPSDPARDATQAVITAQP